MIAHHKKLQIALMFLIACLFASGMMLLSISSSIDHKNETIDKLTKALITEKSLSLSLEDSSEIITALEAQRLELEEQNKELRRDVSIVSETLVEKNLTINQLKQKLNSEQRKFSRYRANYNKKMKNQLANEQRKINAQLEKDRLALQDQEDKLKQQQTEFTALKAEPKPEPVLTAADKKQIDEERVEELMKKFDSYQVDLSVENECDKAYLYRYNEAKSTLSHIRTYLQKNQMDSSYYHFVIANDSSITAQNRKLCLDD